MTKEDLETIGTLIEDAQWRTAGIVTAVLGHFWLGAAFFLLPFFGNLLERFIVRYRIIQLEEELRQ